MKYYDLSLQKKILIVLMINIKLLNWNDRTHYKSTQYLQFKFIYILEFYYLSARKYLENAIKKITKTIYWIVFKYASQICKQYYSTGSFSECEMFSVGGLIDNDYY